MKEMKNKLSLLSLMYLVVLIEAPALKRSTPQGCPRPNFEEASYDGSVSVAADGSTVTVHCKQKYEKGSYSITCIDGKWTKPDSPCKLVRCPNPGDPSAYMEMQMTCRYYNCDAFYSCLPGYWYTGTSPITCQRDTTWTHGVGTCQAVRCPELTDPKNGEIQQPDRSYGETATTVCDEGFIISDQQAATRQCQVANTWSGKQVVCNAVRCPQLTDPPNGRILQSNRTYKATATTVCDEGYVPTDPEATKRYCQKDTTWDGKVVNCTRIPCAPLNNVENGELSALSGRFGDTVTLECNSGYTLNGSNTVTCIGSGNWSAQIGRCIHHKTDTISTNGNDRNLSIALVVGSVLAIVVSAIVSVCAIAKKRAVREQSVPEMQPLFGQNKLYFTFVLAVALGDAYSTDSEYNSFISIVKESIKNAAKDLTISVDVLYLCQSTRRGFLSITSSNVLDEHELVDAIRNSKITLRKGGITCLVMSSSIQVMDKVQCALSAQILRDKHQRDRSLDEPVDFNTQYVKLKLQTHATIGTMQREEMERPDNYQDSLKQQGGTDIEDEDLVKGYDLQNYVLLRGRAGIGKSTLMQRLLWKWANGDWGKQFKAIFLFNLRHLITITQAMDFVFMLNMYSVYRTGRSNLTADEAWLQENEMDIAFVLDGVDEVHGFKEHWTQREELSATSVPIHWCFALMKRQIFNKSTLIVSSRPFADLGDIARTLKDKSLTKSLKLVQLMGLTRERVQEFINKNVQEGRRDFVWQTLVKNPILMSVSSITFYCAALCKILADHTKADHTKADHTKAPGDLTTYTQITAFIMDRFIQRSIQKVEKTPNMEHILRILSKLAFNGLVREIGKGPLRLVFDAKDFAALTSEKDVIKVMTETGLLMQTEILDPEDEEKCTVLSQFVHLMIQEFLAMAGLLSKCPEEFKQLLDKLGSTQQFSMAILFLYGLAFNRENEILKRLDISESGEEHNLKRQEALRNFAKNMPNKLQALQVAHESQNVDVARAVGESNFNDGCHIENVKLTVIDVLALTFVLRHNTTISAVRLERGELDVISVRELVKFLREENKQIGNIALVDDTLTDDCVKELVALLNSRRCLGVLELSSDAMTDVGMASVADALKTDESLQVLHLSSSAVTDNGVLHIAEALISNATLQSLRLVFREMTDVGLQHLLKSIQQNITLKELWMIEPNVTGDGLTCLGQLVNSSITSLRVECRNMTDEVVQQIADMLVMNKTLTKLWLYSTRITDRGVKHLMNMAKDQNLLTEITLYGCSIHEDGVNAILNTSSALPDLLIRIRRPNVPGNLLDQVKKNPKIKMK